MKRTPLERKTPLKQGSGLQRGTPLGRARTQGGGSSLNRSGGLNPRSEKRKADMVERVRLVVALLNERPRCELRWVCNGAPSVDVHERLKRSRGGNILDPIQAHMVTTCRACHNMTEAEPTEAERRRALLPSWHTCPPVGPC